MSPILIPKLIDLHTHLRYPGISNGIEKETLAAVNGGFGTVFSMPNTNPICDSTVIVNDIRNQKSYCNIEIIAAITKGSNSKKLVDFQSLHNLGVNIFSDDGKCVSSSKLMQEALAISKELNVVIAEHAENRLLTNKASLNLGTISKKLNLKGWDRKAEYEIVKRDISLAKKTKGHIHICHISTKESVELIKEGKKKGVNVTAEIAPHHLLWTDNDVLKNSLNPNYKMNPPLRTLTDIKALIKAIKNGTIDCIATDHAPHPISTKHIIHQKTTTPSLISQKKNFKNASFGVIGLETAFITMYNLLVKTGEITLKKLIKLMRDNPAQIGQCDLPVGYFEFFPNKILNYKKSISNGQNTPLINSSIYGLIKPTDKI
jgi:dihydroorotase